MNKPFLALVIMFVAHLSFGQEKDSSINENDLIKKVDSIISNTPLSVNEKKYDIKKDEFKEELDTIELKKAFANQLSALLSGQDANTVGNFASVDIADAKAALSTSHTLKSGDLINIQFTGGVTDGISSVFSDNKLNTNLSAEIQYHKLDLNKLNEDLDKKAIYFNQSMRNLFLREDQKIYDERLEKEKSLTKNDQGQLPYKNNLILELIELLEKYKINSEKTETLTKNQNLIQSKKDKIELNKEKIKSKNNQLDKPEVEKDELKKKTLISEKSELRVANDQLEKEIKKLNNPKQEIRKLDFEKEGLLLDIASKVKKIENLDDKFISNENYKTQEEYLEKLKKLKEKYKLVSTGLKINWLSIGYKVRNDAFNIYNPAEVFDEQIKEMNDVSHELTIQYSWYDYEINRKFKNFYSSLGFRLNFSNNLSKLTSVDVVDEDSQENEDITRKTSKTTKAFRGEFEDDVNNFEIFWDHYHFLYLNKWALHLRPEHQIEKGSKPVTNFTLGLFFSFKDKDKEKKSPVNVEAFYSFRDVFKNTETDLKLFERNNIGLKFTFPINFL